MTDAFRPGPVIDRRGFLRGALGALALTGCARGAPAPAPPGTRAARLTASPIFWIHVQASGGWDQALFCDPKPSVRPGLGAADAEMRQAGAIPYLGFADFGGPADGGFFGRFHDRLLVVNGLDTGTNNHSVGEATCASGSSVPESPCWASQVAATFGDGKPMPFISFGGYDRTAGLVAPARIPEGSEGYLRRLGMPNDDGLGRTVLPPALAARVLEAHRTRLLGQRAAAVLPERRRDLDALQAAREAEARLADLVLPGYDPTATPGVQRFRLALSAFSAGLTASVGIAAGGFDTHDDNTNGQRTALQSALGTLGRLVELTEAAGVPAVILATSDFGRTPHLTGSGTDHHPIASALVLVNAPARPLVPGLPTDRVVGATTDGDVQTALQARRVDPLTLLPDDGGVLMTPGHLLRAMRRAAGVAEHPVLAPFPLDVDADLALG